MGTTYRVANATEFNAALSQVQSGDIIEAEAGHYGEVALFGATFDTPITITSADPDNMATFEKFNFYNTTGVTLDGINIDLEPEGDTGYLVGVRITEGGNITIRNNVMTGGYEAIEGNEELSSKPVGNAVYVLNADNITVENNDISEFRAGITLNKVDGVQILDNDIHDIRTTPLSGGGIDNVLVSGNHFSTIRPYEFGGTGDHGDHIHFYPVDGQEGRMENITIINNFFEQGDSDTAILGIYLEDFNEAYGYQNVVISNNVLHNSNAQGIRLEHGDDVTITNNTFLQATTGTHKDAPGIYILQSSTNVTIDNNITAGAIWGASIDDAVALGNVVGTNLQVQKNNPDGENYVGDLFANSLTYDAELNDLIMIPGSVADGMGASMLQLGTLSDLVVGIMSSTPGAGFGVKTITFDMELVIAQAAEIDLDTATLQWDFGDGTTGTGLTVAHTFALAGQYDVNVTVVPASGPSVVVRKTVEVETVEGLYANFEFGPGDISDLQNATTVIGDVDYVASELGTSLRLGDDNAVIQYERSDEILDNRNFTLSLAFKKDGGTLTESGNLIYSAGAAYLGTAAGRLDFGGRTTTGDNINLSYVGDDIDDGEWHQVTYSFSGDNGAATLYVDGEKVDEQTGVTGVQYTANGHDFNIGGLFGGSFHGLIDEVKFLRTDINEEQAKADFDNLFSDDDAQQSLIELQEEEAVAQPVSLINPDPEPEEELAEVVTIPVIAAPALTPAQVEQQVTQAVSVSAWEDDFSVLLYQEIMQASGLQDLGIEDTPQESVGLAVIKATTALIAEAANQIDPMDQFEDTLIF